MGSFPLGSIGLNTPERSAAILLGGVGISVVASGLGADCEPCSANV